MNNKGGTRNYKYERFLEKVDIGMVLVKILGGIDFASAIASLILIFGIKVFTPYILFCAVLLALKGMFVFTGDI